ncbi:MAG: pyridoxamine 5'-phosphate oxidase [Desulfuromonas sp.]|nr:MAG: pyridoxamine 5'-phosphate oxidase [Desulfuromonas sp.]
MNLNHYFSDKRGVGVLSTADSEGRVDAAIYARPHVMEDGIIAMIMRDRLSHKNLQENPYAVFLFMEAAEGYQGIRVFLKKIREDQNKELLDKLTRRSLSPEEDASKGPKFMVYFSVEKVLQLVGGQEL